MKKCGPEQVFVYHIRLEDKKDGSGPGASLHELRPHFDGLHLGFNVLNFAGGRLGQIPYIGRLQFNDSRDAGSARYDLVQVNQLYNSMFYSRHLLVVGSLS